jgi:hypothetical protein
VNSGNSGSDFAGSGYTVMGYNPWRWMNADLFKNIYISGG